MSDGTFKIIDKNSLGELSELRFDIEELEQNFGLNCRLRFGTMQYQHNDREYEIGISRAFLRLNLEGCETTLDGMFGESVLEVVEECDTAETEAAFSVGGLVDVNSNGSIHGSTGVAGGAGGKVSRKREKTTTYLPVTACPNNSWEISPPTVMGKSAVEIKGTAISNERLCVLRRKKGGNRMSVIAEVQVTKGAIKVAASGGNKMGKALGEWQNKDAIISQVLKLAIQREASTTYRDGSNAVVAISRCEIAEE